jgi:hypothetical protein
MKGHRFYWVCVAIATLSWAAGNSLVVMDAVAQPWWTIAVGVVSGSTALSRWWVASSTGKSPMGFVNAVNGATAVKMFGMLILITSYLVVNEQGRVEFALGAFAVFVAHLTLFVVDLVAMSSQNKKKSV